MSRSPFLILVPACAQKGADKIAGPFPRPFPLYLDEKGNQK